MSELVKVAITETTEDENEYAEIVDIYDVPVVSCNWVTLSHRCGQLLPTKAFPPDLTSTALFKDKVFCASQQISKPDLDSLWAMLTFNGGVTQKLVDDRVTHILSTSNNDKIFADSKDFVNIKFVTPDWVTDSIKASILVEETQYHPKLLVTQSVSALRRQLLSTTVTAAPVAPDLKWKSPVIAGGHVETTVVTPQQPRTIANAPTVTGTAFPSPPRLPNYVPTRPPHGTVSPQTTANRPMLHEMPSGFPGYQQNVSPRAQQFVMGSSPQLPPRHPYRQMASPSFAEPGTYRQHAPSAYGMSGTGGYGMPGAAAHKSTIGTDQISAPLPVHNPVSEYPL